MSVAGTPVQISHPLIGPAKSTANGATPTTALQGSPRCCQVCPPSALRTSMVAAAIPGGLATAQAVVAEAGDTELTGVRDATSVQLRPPSVVRKSVDAAQERGPAPHPDPG